MGVALEAIVQLVRKVLEVEIQAMQICFNLFQTSRLSWPISFKTLSRRSPRDVSITSLDRIDLFKVDSPYNLRIQPSPETQASLWHNALVWEICSSP